MDWTEIVTSLLALLGGAGGISAVVQARANKQVGLASSEVEANKAATTDWDVLSGHWVGELNRLNRIVNQLATDRDADDAYIDMLRDWIWEGKAPPPPGRPPRTPIDPRDAAPTTPPAAL